MLSRLRSIIDIRKGEFALTATMAATYYLLLVAYYFLKPARDSLFLVKVDPKLLPVVFIITALVTVPVISVYNRIGRFLRLHHLIGITYVFVIANLIGLWFLIQRDDPWIYYVFYTWVSIYGALTTSQFWLLANTVFDSSQAKRVFSILGLAGIVGAFTGGEVTGLVVSGLGVATENLLFFCVGLLAAAFVLVNTAWSIRQRQDKSLSTAKKAKKDSRESLGKLFKTVISSRHLTLIVGIIAMTMMVASFVDYQFKIVSREAFGDASDLTAFLGTFYGRLSLVSFVLQIFFAQKLLRTLGVGGVIMLLPIGLMFGSVAMFIVPGLAAAVLLRGADGAIKYSLDKTSRELLILPIPIEIKRRTKMFIDMFVDRWFRGLAGALLLLCTLVLELSIRQISLIVIVLIAFWLFLTFLIRKEYVNAFRTAIEKRQIDPSQIRIDIAESSVLETLRQSLQSDNEREIVYALETLAGVKDKSLEKPCLNLLRHPSAEVRSGALRLLKQIGTNVSIKSVESLMQDKSLEVRRESVHFLSLHGENNDNVLLKSFLNHPERPIRTAALASIIEYGTESEQALVNEEVVKSFLADNSDHGVQSRIQVAKALGILRSSTMYRYIDDLLDDSRPEVVRAAMRSVGWAKIRAHVPFLIDKLAIPSLRSTARSALVDFGEPILGTLKDYLNDTQIDYRVRHQIPRVLHGIATQESVDILLASFSIDDSRLQYHVVRALNKLRAGHSDLKFNRDTITEAVLKETRAYYELAQVLAAISQITQDEKKTLLEKAISEKKGQRLERVFRMMGLQYPAEDIYSAYLGLIGNKKDLRSNAIEFLDNVLPSHVKKHLFPIIDEVSTAEVLRSGKDLFGLNIKTYEEGIQALLDGSDPWLRACAVLNIDLEKESALIDRVRRAENDPDSVVREIAAKTLSRANQE